MSLLRQVRGRGPEGLVRKELSCHSEFTDYVADFGFSTPTDERVQNRKARRDPIL